MYVQLDVSGGDGRAGVFGTGVGFPGVARRLRGSSLGMAPFKLVTVEFGEVSGPLGLASPACECVDGIGACEVIDFDIGAGVMVR